MASGNPYLDDAPTAPAGGSNPYLDDTPAPAAAPANEWGFREYATEGLRAIGTGATKAATSTLGLPADLLRIGQAGLDYSQSIGQGRPYGEVAIENRAQAPGVANAMRAAGSENLQSLVPISPPETRAGKLVAEGINFAGQSAALPFGAARRVAAGIGAAAGLASEGAGQITAGTAAEPYARLGGALAGGIGAGAAQAGRVGSAARSAKTEFEAAIPANERAAVLAKADEIMADAGDYGTQVSYLNALDRAAEGRLNLSVMQADAEGMGRLRPFNAAFPEKNRAAMGQLADKIAPVPANPDTVGPAVGRAAEGVVQDANSARTAAVAEDALAARADTVAPSEIEALVKSLDARIAADKTGLSHGPLQQLRNSLVAREAREAIPAVPGERIPIQDPKTGRTLRFEQREGTPEVPASPREYVTDVENVDRVRKYFRDRTELPAFAPNAIDKETGAVVGRSTGALDTALTEGSEAYARRNAEYARISRETVEPLMQGPIGKLADRDITTQKARDVLFPSAPDAHSAPQVQAAVEALTERAPLAARQLVRAHLERNYAELARANMTGPNENGAAKFVAAMTGNDIQSDRLYAAVRGLPDGDIIADGMRKLFTVFEAQGKRQAQGSNTANKLQRREQAERGGGVAGRVIDAATGIRLPARFQAWAREVMLGRHMDQIAAMATDPKAIAAFRGILKAEDPSGAVGRLSTIAMRTPPGALQIRVQPRTED